MLYFIFYILVPENETIFGEWLIDRTNCKYIYDKQGRAALSTVLIFFLPWARVVAIKMMYQNRVIFPYMPTGNLD